MGGFRTKKTYYAYAGSSGLFDDENRPDTLKSNLIRKSLVGGPSAADSILLTIGTDQFSRAKAQMRYASRATDNHYIRRFPTSNLDLVVVEQSMVEEALTRDVGAWDTITAFYSGAYREEFFLNKSIQEEYLNENYFAWNGNPPANTHWDETRATTTIPVINPDTGLYYEAVTAYEHTRFNIDETLSGESLRDQWGEDGYTRLTLDPRYDSQYIISFTYLDKDGAVASYQLEDMINIYEYVTGNWLMVKYTLGGETFYWSYKVGSNDDPILEQRIEVEAREGEYLPVAVLMQDKIWFDADLDSETYKSTNKLLKYLGTSGDEIKEQFLAQQAEDDASGDNSRGNAVIWDFFIHYAVPIRTNVRGSKEYLWEYFGQLEDWQTTTSTNYYDYLATEISNGYTADQPSTELTITEAGYNGYNVTYRWSFIESKDFSGEFTPDGATEPLKPKEVDIAIYERSDDIDSPGATIPNPLGGGDIVIPPTRVQEPGYQETLDDFYGPGTPIGLTDPKADPNERDYEAYGYHDIIVITRQNPEDPDNPGVPQGYTRRLIMGLDMEYKINTSETEGGTWGYRFRYAQPKLFGLDEETKEFRIPMLYGALKNVPTLHREEAVSDGLTATVFLVELVKVKWYQTGFFAWIAIIILIILIVAAFYYGEANIAGELAKALAYILGIESVIIIYVITFALTYAIGWLTMIASNKIGGFWGQVFAVVVALLFIYAGGGFQNFRTLGAQAIKSPGWGSAIAFLNAVAPIYNMGISVYTAYAIDDLESELKDFELTAKEKLQELQDAEDRFGEMPSWLDPMELVTMFERAGSAEMADSYFQRTLNANPGTLGYSLIDQFAELAVILPKELGQDNIVTGLFEDLEKQRRQA